MKTAEEISKKWEVEDSCLERNLLRDLIVFIYNEIPDTFKNSNILKQNLSRCLDNIFDIEPKNFAKIWNEIFTFMKAWIPLQPTEQNEKIWVNNIEKKWTAANIRCKNEFMIEIKK